MTDVDPRDQLSAYLDGELSDFEHAALEKQLGNDGELRAELEALEEVRALLSEHGRAEAPPGFRDRLLTRLDREVPRRRWSWFGFPVQAVALAAVAVVATVGGIQWSRQQPDPGFGAVYEEPAPEDIRQVIPPVEAPPTEEDEAEEVAPPPERLPDPEPVLEDRAPPRPELEPVREDRPRPRPEPEPEEPQPQAEPEAVMDAAPALRSRGASRRDRDAAADPPPARAAEGPGRARGARAPEPGEADRASSARVRRDQARERSIQRARPAPPPAPAESAEDLTEAVGPPWLQSYALAVEPDLEHQLQTLLRHPEVELKDPDASLSVEPGSVVVLTVQSGPFRQVHRKLESWGAQPITVPLPPKDASGQVELRLHLQSPTEGPATPASEPP